MSEKFKKHIIDNLQPPLVYNLIQLGLLYDKETYEYFICKYFGVDRENITIEYRSQLEEMFYQFRVEYSNPNGINRPRDLYQENKRENEINYQIWWEDEEGLIKYHQTTNIDIRFLPPWLSNNPN